MASVAEEIEEQEDIARGWFVGLGILLVPKADRLDVGNIQSQYLRRPASLGHICGDLLQRLGAPCGQRHLGSMFGQRHGAR